MKEFLEAYLKEYGLSPVDYVMSKFKKYDFVLLGEIHRVKQQLELYHALIPQLAKEGNIAIAYEFARREDQELLDKLLNEPVFDIELAKSIMIRQEAYWGYQEYLDVFQLVWSYNTQESQSHKIKMIGLNDPINWKEYNRICQQENRKPNSIEIKEIWSGCGEQYWLDPITDFYIPGKTKILGIMGSYHSLTKYRESDYKVEAGRKVFAGFNKMRFGNYLYERYQDKVFNICFHDPWDACIEESESCQPASGVIEEVVSPLYKEIGFDLKDSPFGKLRDESVFSIGYHDFKLEDYYDGYIYTGRLADLKPVTAIDNFINESNIELFHQYSPFNYDADKGIKEINQIIRNEAKI